jgi:tetratricopeptide (TPR) repeat protein
MNVWEVGKDDEEGQRWVAAVGEWLRPSAPGRLQQIGPSGQRFVINTDEIQWTVLRHVLERIGKDRPILLWLDDIHLSTPRERAWLERLKAETTGFRLLILATMMTEGAEVDPQRVAEVRELAARFEATGLDVQPLGEPETGALLLSSLSLDPVAVKTAYSRSRGIPLFALQLVHAWANGGSLELRDGSYHVKSEALGAVPATTAALWEERVGSLAPEVQLAAMAASALGGDIRNDVLVPLLTSLGLSAAATIHKLAQAQILVRVDGTRMRWPHTMLQEHLLTKLRAREDAARIFRETAFALGSYHPAAGTRRLVRHRVNNLIAAGDLSEAVRVMLDFVERAWERTRDVSATLDDLVMVEELARGAWAASHKRWKAEALRHAGRFDEAMSLAFSARRAFSSLNDAYNEAQCLRLLGHIASEKGAPRDGREMVSEARTMMEALGRPIGRAQCDVVLGELDYLLSNFAQAREHLERALQPFEQAQDALGKGQCLILLALMAISAGRIEEARAHLLSARRDFDRIGYRLGTAQCDIALAHADHRAGELDAARARAQNALASFRLLGTPRGQAGAMRVMAMAALDAGDLPDAELRASEALVIYERMGDPWGIVEARLLIAQVALARNAPDARQKLEECDIAGVQEREPMQHWHLTQAWLAYRENNYEQAVAHLEAAREVMGEHLGDHSKQLFTRLAGLLWPEPLRERVRQACAASAL